MPAVDTPYIIGAIRSWEKELLGEDEFVRLISAPDGKTAIQAMLETPYGKWLTPESDVEAALGALTTRLGELMQTLKDLIQDESVLLFIQARYDGLNIASALLEWAQGAEEPSLLSELGAIEPVTLHSVIWHNVGWEAVPEVWEGWLRLERERLDNDKPEDDWKYQLLQRLQAQVKRVLKFTATTPLLQRLAEMKKSEWAQEADLRAEQKSDEAIEQELTWDNMVIQQLRYERGVPVGYDPIVAFWYAVEIEIKTLRLILLGKAQGMKTEVVQSFRRESYL